MVFKYCMRAQLTRCRAFQATPTTWLKTDDDKHGLRRSTYVQRLAYFQMETRANRQRLVLFHVQVVLHLQSKWRTRVWQGQYLGSLKHRLKSILEERLADNR